MAWTVSQRGIFHSLPSPDLFPSKVADLIEEHVGHLAESETLRKKATALRQERDQRAREYESTIADAMRKSRKPPANPLPDYDAGIADYEHRSAGALRAAGQAYSELGDALVEAKPDLLADLRARLTEDVDAAGEAFDKVRPLLASMLDTVALLNWVRRIERRASHPYAPASRERQIVDGALGQIGAVLRQLRIDLDDLDEADAEAKRESVDA